MATRQFGPGHFMVEVTTKTDTGMAAVQRDASDVYGDGQRWTFQGGKVLIDFSARVILEERGATLNYRVLHRGTEMIAVSGINSQRRRRGGRSTGQRTYHF